MVTLRINLACARHNVQFVKSRVGVPIYAVVKADAYGHGSEFCRYIENEVQGFAVSCASEAEELRRLKVKKPILIMCPSEVIDRDDIIYTVCTEGDLAGLKQVRRRGLSIARKAMHKVAIKINTGMNRLGGGVGELGGILMGIKQGEFELSEVFTHFSSISSAEEQFAKFNEIIDSFAALGGVLRHCCASNCLTLPKKMHCSAVRCGLALYGYGDEELLPVLSAYTVIEQINCVKCGERVGYGDYVAEKDMKIAVLKAGYADGIRRIDGRCVRINGYLCKIVGRICMDMCMADITDAYAEKGDLAYFLDNVINANMLAGMQNTIPYEILTLFSAKRIKRIYE